MSAVSAVTTLSRLQKLGVRLWLEGPDLRYSAPKGVITPELLADLRAQKGDLVDLLAQTATDVGHVPSRRVPREGDVPVSFAQQRLWFLDQLAPRSPAYNVPFALSLKGELDEAALVEALTALLARHDVLRSTIRTVGGRPVSHIAAAAPASLHRVDMTSFESRVLPEPARGGSREQDPLYERTISRGGSTEQDPPYDSGARELRRRLRASALEPFDLEHGPLVRASLYTLGEQDHVLLLVFHHAVCDGWSLGILNRELLTLYDAVRDGRPSPLDDLPIQYGDFAAWQREWLDGPVLERQLAYWRTRLAGVETLQLPIDARARPAVLSHRGGRRVLDLSAALRRGLEQVSQSHGCTLFMTLAAAFQVLLHRYTGQTDVTMGTPIANRHRREVEGLIGFFVNSLVLRTDLSGDPSFAELLGRVRDGALAAYEHQDLPFEKLVEELHPDRDLSRNPLFQVIFALQNAPFDSHEVRGLSVEWLDLEDAISRVDLEVHVWDGVDRVGVMAQYSTDLFEAPRIERMLGHYRVLLEAVVADPRRRISRLPLLTGDERQRIAVTWNETRSDYPPGQTVVDLFRDRVRRAPTAVAAVCGGRLITYEELDRRSNQLARHLQALGVGPERAVAIWATRSIELILGAVAVVKAGGAYVPLDPSYPDERLLYMLQDSGAAVLLAERRLDGRLASAGVPIVPLEVSRPAAGAWSTERADALPTRVPLDHLAYIIYTSGSTGRPKGVAIAHEGLVNLARWHVAAYGVGLCDRATLIASTAFDASVWEVWPYLIAGAALYIPNEETRLAPGPLISWMRAAQITHTFLPTPMAEAVLADPDASRLDGLRYFLTGGDVLHRVDRRNLPFTLVNHYGPTESTVVATSATVARGDGHPPIGRPIANTQTYLLDAALEPVPVGIQGELYIGGVGLARGYVGQPELTAERFVPNPFGPPGTRLYRTGDRASYREDGQITFHGRLDQQVKLRGFRIELGEIEHRLRTHPAVSDCAVTMRAEGAEQELVAHIVPQPGASVDTGELRGYLAAALPSSMVPGTMYLHAALPRLAGGKLDRRALESGGARLERRARATAPANEDEQRIARLFAELLGVREVGADEDFFEIGGHSLLALRLVDRIQRDMGGELPLAAVFHARTPASLAAALTRTVPDATPDSRTGVVTLKRGGAQPALFFVAPVLGVAFPYLALSRALDGDRPIYGLQPRGVMGEAPPHRRVEDLAAWYVDGIRKVQPQGPYLLAGWSFGGVVIWEMARLLREAGETPALLAIFDVPAPRSGFRSSLSAVMRYAMHTLPVGMIPYAREYAHLTSAKRRPSILERSAIARLIPGDARQLLEQQPAFGPMLRVMFAGFRASLAYRPEAADIPVTLFRTNAFVRAGSDTTLGWKRLARDIRVREVPGDHMTLLREPHVRPVARALAAELARASAIAAVQVRLKADPTDNISNSRVQKGP